MITLTTLKDATAQEVFDQVATHLLTQNKMSYGEKGCMYRSGNLKCAAGCLISDEEYNPEMEEITWDKLISLNLVPNHHSELIRELQSVHDTKYPDAWRDNLLNVAKEFNLSTKVLNYGTTKN